MAVFQKWRAVDVYVPHRAHGCHNREPISWTPRPTAFMESTRRSQNHRSPFPFYVLKTCIWIWEKLLKRFDSFLKFEPNLEIHYFKTHTFGTPALGAAPLEKLQFGVSFLKSHFNLTKNHSSIWSFVLKRLDSFWKTLIWSFGVQIGVRDSNLESNLANYFLKITPNWSPRLQFGLRDSNLESFKSGFSKLVFRKWIYLGF